ncbi:hypothetical protein [Parachryseolinea silvisoli]|uniref:hypothetical protein n=1 Tax=Parachryseolinea silvisoli TaxID=2873601 RepID=UPI002265F434|nr:hypothetical protein [Parachryseolinea silvisoli]MCD9019964.1 hypothetical protein [Parachryseolinea silvisoli]
MKRLPLLITIGLVVVLVGGYYLYDRFLVKRTITPWALVPEATIFVYETNDCPDCVRKMQETSLWSVFREAAFYGKPTDSLRTLFDFIETQPRGQLISAHQTRKDDFDFVFYVPLNQLKSKNAMLDAWDKLTKEHREFNGIQIHEITSRQQTFSWTQIDDVWIGSFTPFLLEDVIRAYTAGNTTLRSKIASLYQMPRSKNDAGNLFINIRNFGVWLNSFAAGSPSIVNQIGQASLLDIKTDEQSFTLNGFSLDSASQGYILSVFNNQVPVPFNLKNFVSNRSVMVSSFGISDGVRMGEALKMYAQSKNPGLQDSIKQVNTAAGLSLGQLYQHLGKEVGVCFLESKDRSLSKIVLIETKDPKPWISAFNTIAQKTSMDTIFFERFSDYEIREMPVPSFPEKLFWPLVTGLKTSFYTAVGNTIILSENVDDLKQFLDDIDKEETWGKSVAQNKFLEGTLLESNVNLYVNTPLVWNILSDVLHPRWQKFVQENQASLESIGMGAVQMSHLNNSYYTNITWTYGKPKTSAAAKADRTDKTITSFQQGIHKIFVVRNHNTKEEEVLVQDSSRALSLVSADGKALWKIDLDQFIAGDVTQVDFYKNNKLQFFFATPGQLHVVDRLGNYVKPFPVAIGEKDIEFTSVIDYDHSKKYRFLVAGKSGKLWMYDKDGSNLDGWKPKNVESSLSTAPQHHRIRGKDYIVAIRKDGIAYLMNRRGENLPGFPVDLDARPVGDYALEVGNSLATTYFVIVSRDGFRIKFDMSGKVQSRESLIKTAVDARFSLVRDLSEKSYLVVRQEARQLTVFDETLKEIVGSDFVGNNPAEVRFYNFGGGRSYVTLTDLSQDLSFVYDLQGNLITSLPLESSTLVLRPASGDKPKAYYSLGQGLTLMPL